MSFVKVSISEVTFADGNYGIERVLDKWIFSILNDIEKRIESVAENFKSEMETIAKSNIKQAGKVVSSELIEAFRTEDIVRHANGFILNLINDARANVFDGWRETNAKYELPYWRVIEGGRRAGERMPPPGAILKYLQQRSSKGVTRSDAFAVAMKIGENGIGANKMLFQTIRGQILKRFMDSVNKG